MEHVDQANLDSLRVAIKRICRDLCEIKGVSVNDIPKFAQDAIQRNSGFSMRFMRQPNLGRCFPLFYRPWIGSDRTLNVEYYINGDENALNNNSQHYFEQLSIGIVLAHIPDFVDDHLAPTITFESFRKEHPQIAILANEVCDTLEGMVCVE